MESIGPRGQIDMGIRQYDTIQTARTKRRRRTHQQDRLLTIEHQLCCLNQSAAEDMVLWRGKHDVYKPQFSTRDTWNHVRTTCEKVSWHKGIWFGHATPKFRFCIWLAIRNRLTTRDCVLCNQHLETRNHLFFECSYTSLL